MSLVFARRFMSSLDRPQGTSGRAMKWCHFWAINPYVDWPKRVWPKWFHTVLFSHASLHLFPKKEEEATVLRGYGILNRYSMYPILKVQNRRFGWEQQAERPWSPVTVWVYEEWSYVPLSLCLSVSLFLPLYLSLCLCLPVSLISNKGSSLKSSSGHKSRSRPKKVEYRMGL